MITLQRLAAPGALAATLFLITTCASVNTGGDTEAPIVEVRALHGPNNTKLFRTTRPGVQVQGLGCPNGNFSGAYVTDLSSGQMDISVTSLDPGGTREINLTITPVRRADIVDIECPSCFEEEPGIEVTETAPLEVTVAVDLSNITPRNLQTIKFRATGLDTLMTMNVEALDLNGNRTILVENTADNVSFYAADIMDDGVCDLNP